MANFRVSFHVTGLQLGAILQFIEGKIVGDPEIGIDNVAEPKFTYQGGRPARDYINGGARRPKKGKHGGPRARTGARDRAVEYLDQMPKGHKFGHDDLRTHLSGLGITVQNMSGLCKSLVDKKLARKLASGDYKRL